MSELRLILLIIGVLIIAGVFLFSRRSSSTSDDIDSNKPERERTEPILPESIEGFENFLAADEPKVSSGENLESASDNDQKIIVLNILPLGTSGFDGRHVLEAFSNEGLEFGVYDIFHYTSKANDDVTLFSIANMLEPGSFDLDTLPGTDVSGLAVFTALPVRDLQSVDVFAEMLAISRRVAETLGGEVTDESRSTLTRQTAHHLRESIVAFDAQLGRSR